MTGNGSKGTRIECRHDLSYAGERRLGVMVVALTPVDIP